MSIQHALQDYDQQSQGLRKLAALPKTAQDLPVMEFQDQRLQAAGQSLNNLRRSLQDAGQSYGEHFDILTSMEESMQILDEAAQEGDMETVVHNVKQMDQTVRRFADLLDALPLDRDQKAEFVAQAADAWEQANKIAMEQQYGKLGARRKKTVHEEPTGGESVEPKKKQAGAHDFMTDSQGDSDLFFDMDDEWPEDQLRLSEERRVERENKREDVGKRDLTEGQKKQAQEGEPPDTMMEDYREGLDIKAQPTDAPDQLPVGESIPSEYVTFTYKSNGLELKPTPEFVNEWSERLKGEAEGFQYGDLRIGEIFEPLTTEGWSWVRPEDIGALTDADIIADGYGNIFADMNYMVQDTVEELVAGNTVTWVYGGTLAEEDVGRVLYGDEPDTSPTEARKKTAVDDKRVVDVLIETPDLADEVTRKAAAERYQQVNDSLKDITTSIEEYVKKEFPERETLSTEQEELKNRLVVALDNVEGHAQQLDNGLQITGSISEMQSIPYTKVVEALEKELPDEWIQRIQALKADLGQLKARRQFKGPHKPKKKKGRMEKQAAADPLASLVRIVESIDEKLVGAIEALSSLVPGVTAKLQFEGVSACDL